MKLRIACAAAVAAAVLSGGCTQSLYSGIRTKTSVVEGMPSRQEIAALTRHRMTVGAEETYTLLVELLQAEGCLIEAADRETGFVLAREVLPAERSLVPAAGEIRRMSFLVEPSGPTSEVRLTIYVGRQWYSGETASFWQEELGLATDPAFYERWFDRLDRSVPR